MVGVKGRSGRKPDLFASNIRHKKISFYVKEKKENGKWELDQVFRWFKLHHGTHWQGVVRKYMENDMEEFKKRFWPCKCPDIGVPGKLKHWRELKCHGCGEFKDDRARRMYGDL
jgi:hypothetical protein